jgi:hypothetical protein
VWACSYCRHIKGLDGPNKGREVVGVCGHWKLLLGRKLSTLSLAREGIPDVPFLSPSQHFEASTQSAQ